MKNKYILAALCATAFSGINLIANPSLLVGINDQEIREYCIKNIDSSSGCQKLIKVLEAGSLVIDVIIDDIKKEMNENKANLKDLLNKDFSEIKEIEENLAQ